MKQFVRTEMLLGAAAMDKLRRAHVAVFGIGGVGSFAAEALARSGVGTLSLFDHDVVSESNLNRQLIALHSTLGQKKVDAMTLRIADINPACTVHAHAMFLTPDNAHEIDLRQFDCVIDAIDTVSSKIALIVGAQAAHVPIISCMGAGNKLDPTAFRVGDLYDTSGCPLARVLRKELRARGVTALRVVYSRELAKTPLPLTDDAPGKRQTPGSVAFVPSVAGLTAAGEAIRMLTDAKEDATWAQKRGGEPNDG